MPHRARAFAWLGGRKKNPYCARGERPPQMSQPDSRRRASIIEPVQIDSIRYFIGEKSVGDIILLL